MSKSKEGGVDALLLTSPTSEIKTDSVSSDSKSNKDEEEEEVAISPARLSFANLSSPKAKKSSSHPRRSSILINRDKTVQLNKSPTK